MLFSNFTVIEHKNNCIARLNRWAGCAGCSIHSGSGGIRTHAIECILPAETQYAQIEKKCLASIWACEKFDKYLRGVQQFNLLIDHKPLVPLINETDVNAVHI